MRLPIRPLRGRWPAALEARGSRWFWFDPRVILEDEVGPVDFRTAMDALRVGGTVKITAENRHPGADALLVENVDLAGATIVDIGASDGSTSIDLIRALPTFQAYVIADLYLTIDVVTVGRHDLFFDGNGDCVLVCGPRGLAWPSGSPLVRRLYGRLIASAARTPERRRPVLLLNPTTRALLAADPRVSYAVHDVFRPWPRPAPDVIKVANLLGPYFSDEKILEAAQALLESLEEGGHLLIVDNGRITGAEPRGGLYRRSSGRFTLVAQTATAPFIDNILRQARAGT
jgi:hypothetical protein